MTTTEKHGQTPVHIKLNCERDKNKLREEQTERECKVCERMEGYVNEGN